jgi:hypothetical protein
MDPKKLAEEILDELFPQQEVVYEEADEDEEEGDEEEGEEEESEEGSEHEAKEPAGHEAKESKGGNAGKNQASLSMKSSMASASTPSAPSSASGTQDLSGKGVQPFPGGGSQPQTLQVTNVSSESNQATLKMKPSFAGVQMPSLNKEKVQEDVKTLFGADVSEEFVEKASSLYEASLNTNLQAITEEMAVLFEEKLAEEVVQIAEGLETKINDYLTYVVEEWVKENQLAVDNGLRTEIAENFIEGLKNLFVESYIEVPEDKTNIFDEMTVAIENLENRVNEELENNIALKEKIALLEATSVFEEETKSLKTIDVENLRKLAENVEFSSTEDFRSKVKLLVENYTKVKTGTTKTVSAETENTNVGQVIDNLMEENQTNDEPSYINETIKMYSEVLGRTVQG